MAEATAQETETAHKCKHCGEELDVAGMEEAIQRVAWVRCPSCRRVTLFKGGRSMKPAFVKVPMRWRSVWY